ncbi:MAG: hypothetical protein QG652_476 [Pseudomonadota bacterium]|nr:hypothetical protein [Pseudomonadota bacterium]
MINRLHQFIGNSIEHEGKTCRLIEILETEQAMVFVCPGVAPVIQANQHGEAGRHAPQIWTVPLLSSIGNDLHPVAKQVFPASFHAELLAILLDNKQL